MIPEWKQAARNGDVEALDAQLAAGADPDARDEHGQTALMLAATAGHLAVVERLIEVGADLDVTAKSDLTATMLAVTNGHYDVARALARAGADLARTGTGAPGFDGKTASALAIERGEFLLARELDPSRWKP